MKIIKKYKNNSSNLLRIGELNKSCRVKRIYFFGFTYVVGGGEKFFLRLIELLLKFTEINVGIIDINEGILSRSAKKFFSKYDIDYVPYEGETWKLEDNSCVIVPTDYITHMKRGVGKNVTILGLTWTSDTAWEVLIRKKDFKPFAKLINEKKAITFIDYGIWAWTTLKLKQNFEKIYIPLYFNDKTYINIPHKVNPNEIHICWLGRISSVKTRAIINLIENFSKYKTNKNKFLHIIGNGVDLENLKIFAKKYENKINFIYKGILTGIQRDAYLKQNVDLGFAMGTAMLNFANLGIPVMGAHESFMPYSTDTYLMLFDMKDYCLGSPLERKPIYEPLFENIRKFNDIIDDIIINDKYNELGEKCRKYYHDNHMNISTTINSLITAVNNTQLTFDEFYNCMHQLPYAKGIYEVENSLINIPVLKRERYYDKEGIKLFGIRLLTRMYYSDHYIIKFLGIPVYYKMFYNKRLVKTSEKKILNFPIYRVDEIGNQKNYYFLGINLLSKISAPLVRKYIFLGIPIYDKKYWLNDSGFPGIKHNFLSMPIIKKEKIGSTVHASVLGLKLAAKNYYRDSYDITIFGAPIYYKRYPGIPGEPIPYFKHLPIIKKDTVGKYTYLSIFNVVIASKYFITNGYKVNIFLLPIYNTTHNDVSENINGKNYLLGIPLLSRENIGNTYHIYILGIPLFSKIKDNKSTKIYICGIPIINKTMVDAKDQSCRSNLKFFGISIANKIKLERETQLKIGYVKIFSKKTHKNHYIIYIFDIPVLIKNFSNNQYENSINYYLGKIPLLTTKKREWLTEFYLLGLKYSKIKYFPEHAIIYFINIPIYKKRIFWPFEFINLNSPLVKEQNRNKYSIDNTIFGIDHRDKKTKVFKRAHNRKISIKNLKINKD